MTCSGTNENDGVLMVPATGVDTEKLSLDVNRSQTNVEGVNDQDGAVEVNRGRKHGVGRMNG